MIKVRWFMMVLALVFLVGTATAEEGFAPAPEQVHPLLVGRELPTLALKTTDDMLFDLNAENAKKPLVVVFYRGHW